MISDRGIKEQINTIHITIRTLALNVRDMKMELIALQNKVKDLEIQQQYR